MISLTITINDSAPYATQTIAPESLFGEGLFLGRASDAGIHLDDVSISRKHARLYISEGVFYIVDIGSRSGTDVAGAWVETCTHARCAHSRAEINANRTDPR